jgi:hypothetical protein
MDRRRSYLSSPPVGLPSLKISEDSPYPQIYLYKKFGKLVDLKFL